MTLRIRTARVNYRGPDRLDVTRKSGCHLGKTFAPSWKILGPALAKRKAGTLTDEDWQAYRAAYIEEMRASYRADPNKWGELLRRERATLVCFCTDPETRREMLRLAVGRAVIRPDVVALDLRFDAVTRAGAGPLHPDMNMAHLPVRRGLRVLGVTAPTTKTPTRWTQRVRRAA